jgi:hypothetical protein
LRCRNWIFVSAIAGFVGSVGLEDASEIAIATVETVLGAKVYQALQGY